MNRQNLYKYITLGKIIRLLSSIEQTDKEHFFTNINYIYEYCTEAGLKSSKLMFEDEFGELCGEVENLEPGTSLDTDTIEKIRNAMIKCESIFDLEARTKDVYELCSTRLNIEALIDNPLSQLIKPEKLNNLAKADFESGCKSLAYGLWTASAFHFMRVIENLTYEYAKRFGIIRGEKETMGNVIQRLKNKTNRIKNIRKYDEKITCELDEIRSQYRNPTQHPDAIYSETEAENLFQRSISIISGILNKL